MPRNFRSCPAVFPNVITLAGLSKTYTGATGSIQALRDIDLTIESGEIFGIIGRSGAGKSTLIRCINLLERPTTGSVSVSGINLTSLSAGALRKERREIGMIFQHFHLLSSRTVYGNVALPLELAGKPRWAIDAAVMPLLDFVGLREMRDRYPAQISGGQAQRVGIARALATRPKVLLCDEATSALDPQTTQSILQLLRDVNRELGVTIVLITHEMPVIKAICGRVAFLENGRIAECGSVREIFLAPAAQTTREFIGAASAEQIEELTGTPVYAARPPGESNAVWRLAFSESAAHDSLIGSLIRRYPLDLTILGGSIERVGGEALGVLILEIAADAAVNADAQRYVEQNGAHVEVMGYVQRSLRAAS